MDSKTTAQERDREVGKTGDSAGESHMTAVTNMNTEQSLLKATPAANADRLGETSDKSLFESTGAWDSYEVWRRFFKEARERREQPTPN
jgi:hypothetical protein